MRFFCGGHLCILLPLFVIACGAKMESPAPAAEAAPLATAASEAPASAPTGGPTSSPARIVTLAPSITEIVFALGCSGRVVGVSDFCVYPPEAMKLPQCGGWENPNFEMLASLKPDLVVIQGRHERVAQFCNERGIPVLRVEINSIATLDAEIAHLGKALGAESQAAQLRAHIEKELDAVRSRTPPDRRPKVFVAVARLGGSLGQLMSAGGGTFLDELVTLAGGDNVFNGVKDAYPQVSKEALVLRRPEAIIEIRPGEKLDADKQKALRADWAALSSLPAVRKGHIRFVTEDFALFPGPRVAQTAAAIKKAIEE
ncbi:MAG: helical backbone metal receptor [Candidatus Sumerlaeota bacterium]|nr:helical backbone metal receptor [Candidatus Sumerlaeota bacterium]